MLWFLLGVIGFIALVILIAASLARSAALGDQMCRDSLDDRLLDDARDWLRDRNVHVLPPTHR